MTKLTKAVNYLKTYDEYKFILEHLTDRREDLLVDFKAPEIIENPQALSCLAGKIEAIDSVLIELGGPLYRHEQPQ